MFDELCLVLLAQQCWRSLAASSFLSAVKMYSVLFVLERVYFDGKLVVFTKWRTIFVLNCVHCCSYVSIEFFHHFVPSQLQL